MLKNTPFLRWWLSFILILLGTGTAGYLGLFGQVNGADITKISFLIYGLFAIYTVLTGINTKKACKEGADVDALCRKNEAGNFVSSLLMGLGLIGTVIGFIFMSDVSFADLKMDNISSMKDALANMGAGISTALYTTAVGQICGWTLRIQLFNLSQHLESIQAHCDCHVCKESRETGAPIGEEEDV
jgi:hypothetical protein